MRTLLRQQRVCVHLQPRHWTHQAVGLLNASQLSEAVIAYANREAGILWQQLFQRPYFSINLLADVPGAEMCGTLKNIVAIGAGIGDGLGVGRLQVLGAASQGIGVGFVSLPRIDKTGCSVIRHACPACHCSVPARSSTRLPRLPMKRVVFLGCCSPAGPNSKASILRQGLSEMRQFCKVRKMAYEARRVLAGTLGFCFGRHLRLLGPLSVLRPVTAPYVSLLALYQCGCTTLSAPHPAAHA